MHRSVTGGASSPAGARGQPSPRPASPREAPPGPYAEGYPEDYADTCTEDYRGEYPGAYIQEDPEDYPEFGAAATPAGLPPNRGSRSHRRRRRLLRRRWVQAILALAAAFVVAVSWSVGNALTVPGRHNVRSPGRVGA